MFNILFLMKSFLLDRSAAVIIKEARGMSKSWPTNENYENKVGELYD